MGDQPTEPAAPDDPAEAIKRAVADHDARGMSRMLLRSAGPRLVRDILGPTLSFYAGWKLSGNVVVGIVLGTTFSLAAFRHERRHGRPGAIAQLVLAFVVLQAVIGLATGSAEAYLIQPAILGTINGVVWLGSVLIGKPLAGVFAREVFPVDEETRKSQEFHFVFRHVSVVFGVFFLVFAVVQLVVLLTVGVDAFVALRVLDAILILALIGTRCATRSTVWAAASSSRPSDLSRKSAAISTAGDAPGCVHPPSGGARPARRPRALPDDAADSPKSSANFRLRSLVPTGDDHLFAVALQRLDGVFE